MHADRNKRGRSRTRVLYWFRTPPGVKVGRTALDDDAIRRIEQQNPGLEFDWPRILKGGGTPPTEPRPPFEARRQDRGNAKARFQKPAPPPLPVEERREPEVASPPPAPPAPVVFPTAPADDLPADGTPAHEKIGQEGVQRLRQRYVDVRAGIFERCQDPARRDELMASADRLNPDAWTSAEEVASGLEQYESVLASLREVVGRKRRRRKRGGGGRRPDAPGTAAPGTAAPADSSGQPVENAEFGGDADDESGPDEDPGDFSS